MAESGAGGQQRAFAKNLSRQSALQIRQSTTATVKALAAQQSRTRMQIVDSLDYEGELTSRRKDLEKETFLNLLLFPQQDISVTPEPWNYRTELCSVPHAALRERTGLFTSECLKFYTSQWHRVHYNYSRFACSFTKVINPEYRQHLPPDIFELDLAEEERLASISAMDTIDGETPLTKRGYLFKGPFPSDGAISVSMKNYRKRWFVLSGSPQEGGYTLNFYKDEKSSNLKGKISLDTCTEIKKNSRHKQYGFDVMTEEEKVFYPLAADSEAEMEEWISLLSRAMGMEVEETDTVPVSPLSSYYQQETLRDTKKIDISHEMLEYTSSTDATAAKNREKDRHPLFHVYPELMQASSAVDDHKLHAPLPEEKFGIRFKVKCHDLKLKLTADRDGRMDHVEPFFVTLALFDASKGLKISEDFHIDLNDQTLRQMLPPLPGSTHSGPHPHSQHATSATEGLFSVTFPHQDVYLVARVEKVLQAGISACAEPYIKTGENTKIAQKLAQQMGMVCTRLGHYRMPFAWAVRPLFTSMEVLDTSVEFSPLYKQEREKLTDEELIKILAEFKNLHKQKLQVIPGTLHIEIVPFEEHDKGALTPSLLPLKSPFDEDEATPRIPVSLEVQEFPPLEAFHPHSHYHPHLTLSHHFYIYPLSLKYDAQKAFTKARNVACCVQFRDSDSREVQPLPVIYSKTVGAAFTDRSNTAVLHHCTSPCFYEEVKVKLPVKLKPSHHILFTFYHISCDVQKVTKSTKGASKQPPVEAVVGYAWIPLLDSDGRVLGGLHNLPVAANLPPGYLALSQPETARGTANPDIRWVDGHKPIFRVSLKLDSTIYTQDPDLHTFFSLCEHLDTFGVEGSLQAALKSLSSLELATIIQFLPVILSQLFRLLSLSSKELEGVKPDVLRQLLLLVEKVANADRTELLRSYIEYMFVTEVDSSKKRGVHDELARLLVQCLRQQDPLVVPKLLDHLWFFLEVMLKSMAQFLTITKKMASSRKTRYPEDFGWNLQSFITILLTHIRERFSDLVAKRANRSLADFVKCLFSFMDRGVVFKIVARYLEGFSVSEHLHLSELKLEFLRIVCDHEHFVALNLPFPVAPENMEYSLTDEFCRKHFLAGVLLREVQSALEYEAGPVRRRSIRVLRNLLAKHDCDPRYADPGQKARIAALYFPLIPLVLDHVTRLDPGTTPYISPMLNATSMASFQARTAVKGIDSIPPSLTGTLDKEKGGVGMERGTFSNSDLPSAITSKFSPSKGLGGTLSSSGAPSLPRIESEMSLDPETSMTSDNIPPPSPLEQTMLELDKLSVEETRDLLVSTLFVLKYLDTAILLHWWRECMGPSEGGLRWSTYKDTFPALFSRLLDFFDLLESCLYTFKYTGRRAVALKISTQASVMREPVDSLQGGAAGAQPQQGGGGGGGGKEKKKYSSVTIGSNSGAAPSKGKIPSRSTSLSTVSTGTSSLPHSPLPTLPTSSSEEVEVGVKVEGALANEVGLIILSLLDSYTNNFRKELCQDEGDNILMVKYFSLLVTFLQVTQSATLQSHVFAVVKAFIHKFMEALFKGSPEYCGILCYELLQCCNSRLPSIRIEATALVYLLMRCNFEYFKGRGFVRTHLQSTIAVSKVVSTLLGQSDSNLRRTLTAIASYSSQDERVQGTPFPAEVKDLMRRLKTVLSSTAQMKAHQFDPEKLVDLHYSLAKSYGNSPELRHVWLDSMAVLHLKYGNYSEAAHCCIHIAGLVAQYLKIKGQYPAGCAAFRQISPNVELEESGIKEDRETAEEQQFTEHNLVSLLESSINYLEQAQRYEVMAEVYKLLQPFYEKARDFKHMMEMYGKLHEAFRKVVSIMTTGRRYLGTYFRVAFFGRPFGDDHERQYIYKEPNVTTLAELTLRLQKLYSRKFGSTEIVHIIQESVKVNPASLDLDHAHIQITHTEPYFTTEELEEEHRTRFERQNKISRFVFETPFTQDGRTHGDVTKQCIRKTILTTSHWFPYVKKRILVIDVEQFELKPVEVAIEAMEKKTNDLAAVVRMEPPDLKRLQLLLQGSISTQVNQGVQEYAAFLKEPQASAQSGAHTEKLREVYRSFMEVCQDALELNGRLISTDQLLYHEELRNKFQQIQTFLGPILNIKERPVSPSSPTDTLPRRSITRVDPHRMSAVLFHSISGNK